MPGWNTAVGAAADLQLTASMPNGSFLEYWHPAPYVSGILKEPFLLNDEGCCRSPTARGRHRARPGRDPRVRTGADNFGG